MPLQAITEEQEEKTHEEKILLNNKKSAFYNQFAYLYSMAQLLTLKSDGTSKVDVNNPMTPEKKNKICM